MGSRDSSCTSIFGLITFAFSRAERTSTGPREAGAAVSNDDREKPAIVIPVGGACLPSMTTKFTKESEKKKELSCGGAPIEY